MLGSFHTYAYLSQCEDRFVGIGFLKNFVVVVVYAEPEEDTIRIISLPKALKYERKQFEEALRNQLDEG